MTVATAESKKASINPDNPRPVYQSCLAIMAERGINHARLDDVARVLGCPTAELIRFISSPQHVFDAMLAEALARIDCDVIPAWEDVDGENLTEHDMRFDTLMTGLEALAPYHASLNALWQNTALSHLDKRKNNIILLAWITEISAAIARRCYHQSLPSNPRDIASGLGLGGAILMCLKTWLATEPEALDETKLMGLVDQTLHKAETPHKLVLDTFNEAFGRLF